MRKANREIKDRDALRAVLDASDTCRLAFFDEDAPYIVPLNFGYTYEGDSLTLYFHSAMEGKKLALMRQNGNVGFELDCSHELKTDIAACDWSMNYESIIGKGKLQELTTEQDKLEALTAIMRHYGRADDFTFDPRVLAMTAVLGLEVASFTGKRLMK